MELRVSEIVNFDKSLTRSNVKQLRELNETRIKGESLKS